jgi:hypothetical protein
VQIYGKCNNVNGHGHNYVGEFIIMYLYTVFVIKSRLNRIMNYLTNSFELYKINTSSLKVNSL